ncbi:hypothetical protein C4D60_Mb11t23800 [Musa balbisiana]|uniref:Metal transporter n=1 Tax=Musa balbisiana TaxID=52838 RepID=A0A4S8J8R7_MUSBA|nr:hypothetical protein C4D60_Mb11t23800 [Musa balbisiana]
MYVEGIEMELHEGREIRRDGAHGRGSRRVAAAEEEINGLPAVKASSVETSDMNKDESQELKAGWKKFLAHVGPGFLVSLAYLDPGNLETDLQAGANHRYELLWVILIGLIFALIIQSLAANLGVTTGKHLAELCKAEYPKFVKYCLWVVAELAVIAADIPEGVLITGLSTLLLLGLQRYGVRKLELLISVLVFVMAACFFGELSYVKPPASEVIRGLFVPRLKGDSATSDAIALLGALVMPHNLFLHSALVLSRKTPPSVKGINDACRYFLLESGFALLVALLINIAVVSVSGTGFLDIKMRMWLQNLMTRCVAIGPSLIVSIIGGSAGAGKLIIIASIIVISWILGVGLIGINIYFLSTSFVDWIIHSSLPRPITVLIGIVVFPFMAVYILAILYLAFRKDRVVTFVDKSDSSQIEMEDGVHRSDGNKATEVMPYREDLAHIPFPN